MFLSLQSMAPTPDSRGGLQERSYGKSIYQEMTTKSSGSGTAAGKLLLRDEIGNTGGRPGSEMRMARVIRIKNFFREKRPKRSIPKKAAGGMTA
jgi:hypothetical protein